MSASCTVPGSNGAVRSAGACGSPLDLGSEEDLRDVAGPSSGGRRNKRKNFQPRNIRHDDDQPLDLTEADEETSRKRSRLVTDDEDGRSETSGSTEPSDHQQAVDLSVRPGSASSSHDDEASLRMNMLLWQRGQLLNQFPSADLSEVAVRHLIAGLYALPGREALNGLDPRLPLQELQEVAKRAVNSHQDAQTSALEHQSMVVPRPQQAESLTKDATASSSGPPLPSLYDTLLYNKQIKPEGSATSATSTSGDVKRPGQSKNNTPIDYSRYVKRFASALECASPYCKDLSYREHFHCLDCQNRVFVKKEEMIRHFKWHKKRDESLQHGFMRYSPGDDCNDRYSNCPHNRKQTHYHCVKTGCDKVYISTSDVQMHANYHRKDSAIIQEGFQRFRATEDCATAHCAFNGQRTTHFHCRRAPCNYTFKNKADMEKHKSYHIKDEQLTRDGFKKFMKNEACNFENCRFSRVCNHIHCIRTGCNYVLHSSGQLYSHKRKHERRDAELAYQEGNSSNQITSSNESTPISNNQTKPDIQQSPLPTFGGLPDVSYLMRDPSVAAALLYGRLPPALINQLDTIRQSAYPKPEEPITNESNPKQFDCQFIDCQVKTIEHYHCPFPECKKNLLRSLDAVKEHVGKHEKQDRITDNYYVTVEEDDESCASDCQHKKSTHYHCAYESCQVVVLRSDEPFKRLDHYKTHEARQISTPATSSPNKNGSTITASLDSMFRRKRGRPPKNRVIEVWNESSPSHGPMPDTPQAIFTSFKLPKPATSPSPINPYSLTSPLINQGLIRPGSPDVKRRESPAVKVVQSAVHETSKSPDSPARNLTVVKASGTFFPSPALTKHDELNASTKESPGSGMEGLDLSQGSISRPSSSLERADSPNQSVQSEEAHLRNGNQEDASVAFGAEVPCGRPFCKLKKREHYHCIACSQAFSEIEKLKPHMLKHCSGALSPHMSQLMNQHQPMNLSDLRAAEEQQKVEIQRSPIDPGPSTRDSITNESPEALSARSSVALLNFHQPFAASYGLPFHQSLAKSPGLLPAMQSLYASQGFMMNGSPGSSRQSSSSPVDQSLNSDAKKLRIQSSMRILKDEPVPEGYVRFRFNEDCQYPICGYREHQTHFHCMRRDCGYSFCDKTRFVQHTARHERLDTLMGGDFQQYRANVNCGRTDCPYIASLAAGQNKASHFHCLKCDFFCTDTNKVVAHRRQHQKTDSILAAGFEKFTPSQGCRVDSCPHSTKQTHYHCLKCSYAVLGLAQMSAHKYRHMENSSTP